MELLEAWGVPVCAGKLDHIDVHPILDYVVQQRFEDAGEQSGGLQTTNRHLLDDDALSSLREEILTACRLYLACLDHEFTDLFVSNSWCVKLTPYDYIMPHHHSNCYISGVFYLTHGQPLHLHRPWETNEMFTFSPNVRDNPQNALTQRTRQFHPEPQSLIVMPSGLTHHVDPVTSSQVKDRYSLAFNILPKGKFGHGGNFINLQEQSNE